MTKLLLAIHIIAAIIAIGPITVAASMFPAVARRSLGGDSDGASAAHISLLHRICRVYAVIALAVPVFGFATAANLHVLGTPWLIASIGLTAVAALVLGAVILPAQDRILLDLGAATATAAPAPTLTTTFDRKTIARLATCTGLFNLLWATVTVLMILRPGSTTGV